MTALHERAAALLAAEGPHYAERDPIALGEHYFRHVNAMTGERLHSKADIAEQLAYRDALIRELLAENERLEAVREATTRMCLDEQDENERLRARIDALMLEHCPDEMTPEQVAEWERHQVPSTRDAGPTPYRGRTTRRE